MRQMPSSTKKFAPIRVRNTKDIISLPAPVAQPEIPGKKIVKVARVKIAVLTTGQRTEEVRMAAREFFFSINLYAIPLTQPASAPFRRTTMAV